MKRARISARFAAYTALMAAITYVATLIGFSSAQFYFNLGDSAILITASLLGPIPAMLAGGIGSFLADLTVYPATMLYTLVIKAIEGLVAGLLFKLLYHFTDKHIPTDDNKATTRKVFFIKVLCSVLICIFSAGLMMTGYFIAQTFMYGTYASAIVALPMDAAQAAISVVLSNISLYLFRLERLRKKL